MRLVYTLFQVVLFAFMGSDCLSDVAGSMSTSLPPIGESSTEPITYDIPDKFSVGREIITEFKAVSSHGRAPHEEDYEIHMPTKYSQVQVFTRASYLLLVFSPVFATSGIAFISSLYRNMIWYGLLKFAISHSGAVRSLV